MRNIIKLAFSYLKYYRKQTLALFLGMLMSVALLTGIGSLLYSGRLADRERTRGIYGDAHYRFSMDQGNFDNLSEHIQEDGFKVEASGILIEKKTVEAPYKITFVYGDENYRKMFGRSLVEGRYPQKPGEVALAKETIGNLELDGTVGTTVEIDGEPFVLCGVLTDQWDENAADMRAFVSADTIFGQQEHSYLYIKFDENSKVYDQLEAFTAYFHYEEEQVERVSGLLSYVGGNRQPGVLSILKEGLLLPEGKIPYIWGSLNESYGLSEKLILLFLGLFSAFVIFSLFQVSVRKRMAQYSTMQVLGMEEAMTRGVLWTELCLILLGGYPAGAIAGNLVGRILYDHIGKIFVDQTIGSMSGGTHVSNMSQVASKIAVNEGSFHISWGTVAGGFLFLILLLLAISSLLVSHMKSYTFTEMMSQDQRKQKRSRRIYSLHHENMTGVLTGKFMFERKGTFMGILISLSLGGILFLGTTYVVQNTRIHNELTFKADDGLSSDIQVYEDSHILSDVIPEEAVMAMTKIDGIAAVNPVRYLLGELPLENGTFRWPQYYPEIAGEEGWEQDPMIMERYHGVITRGSEESYRLKTNVYGYSDDMLAELSDYLLEGTVDPEALRCDNGVILKTLMDGQGNYDGLAISPGDTIRLKVPKDFGQEEALYFEGPEEWYQEKEFTVAAVVSRPLAKTDAYIGDDGVSSVDIFMTNDQMKENFGVEGYHTISISVREAADTDHVFDEIRSCTSGIRNCLVKDYTQLIQQQNRYLNQKMFFLYGIALILLVISIFHTMNSMQYLVASRKQEYGILRAMGITDGGFCRMLVKEGIRYGVYSGIFMLIVYLVVQKILYYALLHVFLYLHSQPGLSLLPMILMAVVNLLICVAAVLYSGREILRENIIDEIRK